MKHDTNFQIAAETSISSDSLNTITAPTPADAAPASSSEAPEPATNPTDNPGEGGEGGKGATPPSPPSDAPASESGAPAAPQAEARDIYRPAPETNPVIDALARSGLYRDEPHEGEHRITCPWAGEHAPGEQGDALYFAPTEAVPSGLFHCPCSHEKARGIGALFDHLKVDRHAARCKATIRVINGEVHRVVTAAEKVLAARGAFYRSNGVIVTLKTDPATGDVTTDAVTEQSLTLHLSAASDWMKYDARSEKWERRDVPSNVVNALHKSQGTGELPALTRLARQPYLRPSDARLVSTPGYDPVTGIYAAFDPSHYSIPLLTRENALAALNRLKSLLTEFEFESSEDRSAALCAMLTASIRDSLKVAPAFNITASSPGSGKSYLASVIAPFAGPGEARSISYPVTNEEATKVVLSLALEQPAAVCFDDMPTDWLPHGAMNRMLTNGSITERVLGSSRVVTAGGELRHGHR
ncbi:hypothetical protein [Sphingomonas jatrophae]|uniref:Uncharacterized protein n=1 Tax=Sphingomonas jatrophae TaxID=1166337 RepID=A0A1I6K0K2_9SPHN|nr:hypothetical protein [Sphingomonas jatrophae]SFR84731.1 hypothetical protein SAMN05192580_1171 [Sphingomonas jatrophae]